MKKEEKEISQYFGRTKEKTGFKPRSIHRAKIWSLEKSIKKLRENSVVKRYNNRKRIFVISTNGDISCKASSLLDGKKSLNASGRQRRERL